MAHDFYLIAHGIVTDDQPLPEPRVVATITSDPRILGPVNAHKILERLAGRLGIVDFEIAHGDPRSVPGYQPPLPLRGGVHVPKAPRRR